jgi:putative hemolysin
LDAISSLTEINLDDLVLSFGWEKYQRLAKGLRAVFQGVARKFAGQMLDFDDAVGKVGLPAAGRQTLGRYVRSARLYSDPLPAGPFLALSNHPGAVDTLALFSALNRADLRIIAVDRTFLKSLPNVSERLFYVTEDAGARMSLVRQVSGHLRSGGAALTFPGGEIEPDPNVYPGAIEALQNWTDSVGVFLRMAPETPILPVLVRGVLWKKTANHPLSYVKKTREERETLAAAFQFLIQILFNKKPLDVTVQIGKPITVAELGSKETQVIHQAVLAEMQRLIENPPEGEGVSIL